MATKKTPKTTKPGEQFITVNNVIKLIEANDDTHHAELNCRDRQLSKRINDVLKNSESGMNGIGARIDKLADDTADKIKGLYERIDGPVRKLENSISDLRAECNANDKAWLDANKRIDNVVTEFNELLSSMDTSTDTKLDQLLARIDRKADDAFTRANAHNERITGLENALRAKRFPEMEIIPPSYSEVLYHKGYAKIVNQLHELRGDLMRAACHDGKTDAFAAFYPERAKWEQKFLLLVNALNAFKE